PCRRAVASSGRCGGGAAGPGGGRGYGEKGEGGEEVLFPSLPRPVAVRGGSSAVAGGARRLWWWWRRWELGEGLRGGGGGCGARRQGGGPFIGAARRWSGRGALVPAG